MLNTKSSEIVAMYRPELTNSNIFYRQSNADMLSVGGPEILQKPKYKNRKVKTKETCKTRTKMGSLTRKA